jgi:hypothetical protein
MALNIGVPIDLKLNEIRNFLIHVLGADPGSPPESQAWYNSAGHIAKYYNGTRTIVLDDQYVASVGGTAPINSSGGLTPTISIDAATGSIPGSMSAADKAKLDAATNANTANAIVRRDSNGDFSTRDISARMVILSGTPSGATDAATKGYVDAVKTGLDLKDSVRVASTGNVNTASAPAAIDGITLTSGDRVLLKDQTTASQNGIWIFNGSGSAMTRATDADANAEVTSGLYTFVEEGTANANYGFVLTTANPIVVGTTALSFTAFSGAGAITAGAGMTKTGSTLDIVAADSSIDVNADSIAVNAAVRAKRYAASFGDNSATSFTITHNLGTRDVIVQVYPNASPYDTWLCDVERTDANTVTLRFTTAPTTNQFRVVILA